MQLSSRRRAVTSALVALAVIVGVCGFLRWMTYTKPGPAIVLPTTPPLTGGPAASWSASEPVPAADVHLAWAYVESAEGAVDSGGGSELHPLDDLTAPALVQEYLNQGDYNTTDNPPDNDDTAELQGALRADADAVDWVAEQVGGRDTAMKRVVSTCSLSHMRAAPVRGSALDVARLGACLREGAIAQPAWAGWVLEQMRSNTGGIGDVRGAGGGQHLAQRNSTVLDGDRYRTGCLAVGAYWSAGILVDYPAERGEAYGLTVCADTARSVFPPDTQQVPEDESPAPATANA